MSLEAVQQVTEFEACARRELDESGERAKKCVADAEQEGQKTLDTARAKAEEQAKELMRQAEENAARHTEQIMEETQQTCGALRQTAQGKLEDAAALIIGKVVGV